MDQNKTQTNPSVDNDLQKAIDDITNTTNVDPVFSDPVAAPSSVPEGDTGELAEPVGPFPEATVATVEKGPEPIAPLESMNIPEFNTPPVPPVPDATAGPTMPPVPETTPAPVPEPLAPEPTPELKPESPAEPAPESAPESASEPALEPAPESTPEPLPQNLSTTEVKKAALRDLIPLLDKIDMDNSEKFKIYRDIFNDLKDYTVLEPAYRAAREITDETERAEALLYLVNSIDKM